MTGTLFEFSTLKSKLLIYKKMIMSTSSPKKNHRDLQQQTLSQNSLKAKVYVADVKPWKDSEDHEKVRRQRQDLFDNWEQRPKKTSS
jgi:hypothetical protein